MVDRWPNLMIAINSCAPSMNEPQPESARTDERRYDARCRQR